jgi:hypothetical protein
MSDENEMETGGEQQSELQAEIDTLKQEVQEAEGAVNNFDTMDEEDLLDYLYYIWMIWGDFQLYIIEPLVEPIFPPVVIPPKKLEDGTIEYVFNIHDEGFRLSTSRGQEGIALGNSMLKFYNTIEKMVAVLVERLKTGGIDDETEVRVAFYGHELGQRKAFESILNLQENVVVTNFDAGDWGERFMNTVLTLVERGYGAPHTSPRKKYPGPLS